MTKRLPRESSLVLTGQTWRSNEFDRTGTAQPSVALSVGPVSTGLARRPNEFGPTRKLPLYRVRPAGSASTGQLGFSYVEVLVAVLVLAICLPPALDALGTATRGAGIQEASIARRYLVSGRMEQVLAEAPASLDAAALAAGAPTTPTSYSDAPGTPERRLVFLARYDLDNADADNDPFTGGDPGLIWVRVAIENQLIALETVIGS